MEDDARIARDRALEAMVNETDELTRASLWRLALKFHRRATTHALRGGSEMRVGGASRRTGENDAWGCGE